MENNNQNITKGEEHQVKVVKFKKELNTLLDELAGTNPIYYAFLGLMRLVDFTKSTSVPTAAILFADGQSSKPLVFAINIDFWEGLNKEHKIFVIAHECLHVIYEHGKRLKMIKNNPQNQKLFNIAMDIAVNETIRREVLSKNDFDNFPWQNYCFVETVFPKEAREGETAIANNRSAEYYYDQLKKIQDQIEDKFPSEEKSSSSPSSGSGDPSGSDDKLKFVDDHLFDFVPKDEVDKEARGTREKSSAQNDEQEGSAGSDEVNEEDLKGNEIEDSEIQSMIDEFNKYQYDFDGMIDQMFDNFVKEYGKAEGWNKKKIQDMQEALAEERTAQRRTGNGAGGANGVGFGGLFGIGQSSLKSNIHRFFKVKDKEPMRNINVWKRYFFNVNKSIVKDEDENDNWFMENRRYADILSHMPDCFLPTQYENEGKNKFDLCIFFDTSKSCSQYIPDFKMMAKSIPSDLCNITYYSFAYNVVELESIDKIAWVGGGAYLNNIIKVLKERKKFPDATLIFSGGYFYDYNYSRNFGLTKKERESLFFMIKTGYYYRANYNQLPLNSKYSQFQDVLNGRPILKEVYR